MEEDLRQLLDLCIKYEDGNPLWPDGFVPFCSKHGITQDQFCYLFAKLVALEFVHGEVSFADGNRAMNRLFGVADINLRGLPWDIYHAFDAGEYRHLEDPEGTISWQKYTLPRVMEVLVHEGLLPRT
ncbi:hypothetical protein GCM10027084_05350 [Pseudoxanthomonas sangjuensis]|uniref:hypothetical protein n=1 Tax=Pseudoxanthomonas sangjuensis TaxID=1503750 RepID=UPI0013914DE1|nr:hypothetical protein [Pseudoxanthomonas sangjuensis]